MDIKQEIEKRIEIAKTIKKTISYQWFERFFAMLEMSGVNEEVIIKTMDYALSADGLERITAKGNSEGFEKLPKSKQATDKFFEYMTNMARTYGQEKFKNFLENSLLQIANEYEEYKQNGFSRRTFLKNLFLKHLVMEHPEDVAFEYTGTPLDKMSAEEDLSIILLKIAGMEISVIKFQEANGNPPAIHFIDFHTLNGLEKMGLGSHLFIEFCKQMTEYKHGYPIIAWNVMKGHDGEKVYSKWGAFPIRVGYENDFWDYDTTPLTPEETDEFYGEHGRLFYFATETIEKIAKQPNTRYGKQEKYEHRSLMKDQISKIENSFTQAMTSAQKNMNEIKNANNQNEKI